jgi:hypothetical protein
VVLLTRTGKNVSIASSPIKLLERTSFTSEVLTESALINLVKTAPSK